MKSLCVNIQFLLNSEKFYLAECYRDGIGVCANPEEARRWFQKAADNHYAKAKFELGKMLANGQGGEKDFLAGYVLVQDAASEGVDEATVALRALEECVGNW